MSNIDKSKLTSLMKTSFGEYIRKLRTENGMTLTQLAAQLELDSANLSKIENGKREFDEKRCRIFLIFRYPTGTPMSTVVAVLLNTFYP